MFVQGVREIFPVQAVRITKDRRRLLEWDTVLLEILDGLSDVPREHIAVYTVIRLACATGGVYLACGGRRPCEEHMADG